VKRVLKYLKGKIDYCLVYKRTDNVDADWANDEIDRKFYTGYVFKLADGAISWESKKQPTVALSSAEAEYMVLAAACKEEIYLQRLFRKMFGNEEKVVIYDDN
jgi:hypothetical protein